MRKLTPSARRTLAYVARLLRDDYSGEITLVGCQQGGVREIRLDRTLKVGDLHPDDAEEVARDA